jgi:hypothetical protein
MFHGGPPSTCCSAQKPTPNEEYRPAGHRQRT